MFAVSDGAETHFDLAERGKKNFQESLGTHARIKLCHVMKIVETCQRPDLAAKRLPKIEISVPY